MKYRGIRLLTVLLVYWAAASLSISSFMERWSFREDGDRFDLPRMLAHTADRPFVYRALVPVTVNQVSAVIPEHLKERITNNLDRGAHLESRFFKGAGKVAWTVDFSFAYHLIYYLDFASLLAAMFAIRGTLIRLPRVSPIAADFVPLATCVLLPTCFLNGGYFYDFPELLFLGLAYLIAFRASPLALLLLIPIATANKETAILIPTLVFPILWSRFGLKKTVTIWGIGTTLAFTTLLIVRATIESSKGMPVELHLLENLAFWFRPSTYIPFTSILAPGIPFPKPQNALCLVSLIAIVLMSWTVMSSLEKTLLLLSGALNIPLVLLFGEPGEFRDMFLMLVPLLIASVRFFSLAPSGQEPVSSTAQQAL